MSEEEEVGTSIKMQPGAIYLSLLWTESDSSDLGERRAPPRSSGAKPSQSGAVWRSEGTAINAG